MIKMFKGRKLSDEGNYREKERKIEDTSVLNGIEGNEGEGWETFETFIYACVSEFTVI